MSLAFTSATSGKQYPDIKDTWKSNVVHKDFSAIEEKQKLDSLNSSTIKDLSEGKSRDKKQSLLEFVKWAQEQQWKGSPDLSTNHDAYFYEAAKEDLEAVDNDDDDVLEAERQAFG
jgi:hypothetical protein